MEKKLHKLYLTTFLFSLLSFSSFSQICYTNLEGTFNSHTTVLSLSAGLPWDDCDSLEWVGTVRWEYTGTNDDYKVYSLDDSIGVEFEDMSMGTYYACYMATEQATMPNGDGSGNLLLHLNTCDELTITGTSQWGEVFTINSQTVDSSAKVLTIEWVNDYGEGGVSVLTRTDSLFWLDVTDADGDGFLSHVDCDDTNPDANPNGVEIANNGVDEDCDGVDLMVGTNDLSKIKLEVFPNPVKNVLYIKTEANINDAQISVVDIHGKVLLQKSITSLQVDLSSLGKGIYFLEINDIEKGDRWMRKIVVE